MCPEDHQGEVGNFVPYEVAGAATNEQIEQVEAKFLNLPQVDCPLTHRFAPGIYIREILMPAGAFIIGHEHKTKHFNIVLSGRALVMINGRPMTVDAPHTFVSEPGVRKVLYILEDMRWQTVHPTDETDLEKLSELLIVKSQSFVHHYRDLEQLRNIVKDSHE